MSTPPSSPALSPTMSYSQSPSLSHVSSIKLYDSLHKGFIETQSMVAPQFYRREKCGCTFLHYLQNGIWYTDNESHRTDCVWMKSD